MSERRSFFFYPLFLGLILLSLRGASAQVPVPPLSGRVVDLTSTLDSSDQSEISAHLEKLEQEKGAQVVVLLIPSTKPESVEEFALRVASEWKLGRKGVDDGVVFLIAKDDRKMRIEVGYGLEGAISDITAKRILSDIVTPYFRAGNLPSGIEAGVKAISGIIKGESLPAPSVRDGGENIIPVGIIIGLAAGSILGGILGRLYGGVLGAALSFTILIFGVSAALSLMISIFVGIFAAFSDAGPGAMLRGGRRYGGGGGFGGGFGRGMGGGGFGGGGGSFGGGGASGNW